jgi:hypothetical protein
MSTVKMIPSTTAEVFGLMRLGLQLAQKCARELQTDIEAPRRMKEVAFRVASSATHHMEQIDAPVLATEKAAAYKEQIMNIDPSQLCELGRNYMGMLPDCRDLLEGISKALRKREQLSVEFNPVLESKENAA